MLAKHTRCLTWKAVYEGDEGQGAKVTPPATFTQEQINAIIAKEKRTWQVQQQELTGQLETLKQSQGLTQQERDELQTRIEQLQSQYMSKEELAKQEAAKREKAYNEQLSTAKSQAETWQSKFTGLFATQQITQAAITQKAFNAEQMVDFLLPRAKVTPKLVDGKPTSEFEVIIPVTTEKDGNVITLELPAQEAVKVMKETPTRYGNFFQSAAVPGLGGGNASKAGESVPDQFDPKFTPEQFAAWRKKVGIAK